MRGMKVAILLAFLAASASGHAGSASIADLPSLLWFVIRIRRFWSARHSRKSRLPTVDRRLRVGYFDGQLTA